MVTMTISERDLTSREKELLSAVRNWAGDLTITAVTERRNRGLRSRHIDARVHRVSSTLPKGVSDLRWEAHGTDADTGKVYLRVESRRASLGFALSAEDRA